MKRILLLICTFFVLSTPVFGATKYVKSSASGSGDGSDCTNADYLPTVMTTADDDDIVILCTGSFGSMVLTPTNSGSSGHPITFQKDTGATCTFTRTGGPSVYLNDNDYIVIDGLTFADGTNRQLYIYGNSTYNEVKNCTFSGNLDYPALELRSGANYNYVHDNTFNAMADSTNISDVIRIYDADYNRVIDNIFSEGGGHSFVWISTGADYNVIRSNDMSASEGYWDDPNKELSEYVGIEKNSNYNLIELNIMTYTGTQPVSTNAEYIQTQLNAVKYNIIRKNIANNTKGDNAIYTNQSWDNEYNLWYNNTYYKINNFASYLGAWTLAASATQYTRYNQFVNNLIHTCTYRGFMSGDAGNMDKITDNQWRGNIAYGVGGTNVARGNDDVTFAQAVTNWPAEFETTIETEPTFTNAGSGDFTALNGSSPQIDVGTWLTTITEATSSTDTPTVDNAYFFYDGWGIPGETGDVIRTASGETATITDINYTTGELTLSASISVVNGEGVSLDYKGTAPDIGAEEYALAVYDVSPTDGGTGVSITASATWDYVATVDDVDVYLDKGTCVAVGKTTLVSDDDADKTYDMSTLDENSTYCLVLVANDGALQGADQEFQFTTTDVQPQDPPGGLCTVLYDESGMTGVPDDQGSTVGE